MDIPIDIDIQYKFLVISFDHHYEKGSVNIKKSNWIGNS